MTNRTPPPREIRDCHDCAAKPGEKHMMGCDVERCMACGGQAISCDCPESEYEHLEREAWTGIWPGSQTCHEYGFWCYWGPDYGKSGWQRCDASHPGATEDLNRLVMECNWDKENRKWVPRTTELT